MCIRDRLTTNLAFTAGAITGTSFVIGNASISEAELEILDGAEVSTNELNKLNGATLTTAELNLLHTAAVGTVTNSKAVIYGANGEVNATTLQISGTSITADAGELNALDLGSTAVGTAIASKAVVIDANKDYSGIRNFTADKLIGDIYSSNGSSKVLEAGTDGTDATFTGNVTGDVYASNGSKILEAGTNGTDAALTGTATKWADQITISATGAATGTATFQGGETSDVELELTLGGTSSTISVGADSGTPRDVSFSASGSRLDIDGTSNEIEAAVSKAGEVVTVQLGLPNDVTIGNNLGVTGDLTVTGSLDVNGTVTTVDSNNTLIKDVLIELGNGRTDSLANDSGIVIERGVGSNAFIGFDESEGKFKVGTGSFTGASTGNLSIATGTLIANIEGTTEGTHKGDIKASDNSVIINHTAKTAALDVTGDLAGTADKAVAVTVTATNTNADYRMIFTHASDNTATDGGIFKDSAGNLKYNPNTNILTSTNFAGDLTGNVTSSGTSTVSYTHLTLPTKA